MNLFRVCSVIYQIIVARLEKCNRSSCLLMCISTSIDAKSRDKFTYNTEHDASKWQTIRLRIASSSLVKYGSNVG
jgi:hypothetical protein